MIAKILLFGGLALAAWWWLRPYLAPRRPDRGQIFERTLDAAEARAILGVDADADADAIRAAHRRLVAAVHPDRGGSTELTRRINLARDTLLKSRPD
ncbi:MAG: DnaJ domain-containing protein [Sphingomonas sp.]|uniref:DnaJ domain-containing protein n=1 Tax=Sphingomonas sp. TaxID=28214 RepID=UPI000DB7932A|nr:DnaJ domain-containing protein [Sphingomonas sp.]PZP18872.1 MAG: molecular chaperone DnaJ [Sphingomonas hengshuiensis]